MLYFDWEIGYEEVNPWANRSEKSGCAQGREDIAKRKFEDVKQKLESALFDSAKIIIALGCRPDSDSPLKLLPAVSIQQIFDFLPKPPSSTPPLFASPPPASEDEVDLTDISLYKPGNKIVVPLTKPNLHLTAPCWRDFSRAVRQNEGWDVKRIAATVQQKEEYKETRKGTVYFINAIFTVPGVPVQLKNKKKRAAPKKNNDTEASAKKTAKKATAKAADGDSKPPAKKKKKANKPLSANAKVRAKQKATKNKKAGGAMASKKQKVTPKNVDGGAQSSLKNGGTKGASPV